MTGALGAPGVDGALCQPRVYFPVFPVTGASDAAGPYYPLEPGSAGGDSWLERDMQYAHYRARKQRVLRTLGRGPLRAREAAPSALAAAEQFLRARLMEYQPYRRDPPRLERLGLDGLMLEIQEDLAIVTLPVGFAPERSRVHYLHVCFPSGWDPRRMLDKNFLSVHARVPAVPGFDRVQRVAHASHLFAQPAVRFIWALTPDDELDHHPDTPRAAHWQSTTHAYLRVERQLIVPLSAAGLPASKQSVQPEPQLAAGSTTHDRTTLFFIRTYIYPVARLSAEQCGMLIQALARMPVELRRYKGMLGHEARIVELLERDGAANESPLHARG